MLSTCLVASCMHVKFKTSRWNSRGNLQTQPAHGLHVLPQEAEAFKIDAGDMFAALDEIAADVATTKAAWDRYAEFLKERNEMANRDWLSMRDQVGAAGCLWACGWWCVRVVVVGGGLCILRAILKAGPHTRTHTHTHTHTHTNTQLGMPQPISPR